MKVHVVDLVEREQLLVVRPPRRALLLVERGLAVPGLTLALSVVSAGALVLLITVFLVVESASIAQKLRGTDRFGRMDVKVLKSAARDVQRYLLIKTVTSATTEVSDVHAT